MLPTFSQYSSEPQGIFGHRTRARSPGSDAAPAKPLRKQVSRACDWCRARRVKCDNNLPCRACRQRGAECTNRGTDEARTLPQAMKEIDRLRLRVQELETELKGYRNSHEQPVSAEIPTPPDTDESTTPDSNASSKRPSPNGQPTPKAVWQGIHTSNARTDRKSYYGPSSYFYFISRIGAYLGKSLQQPCADHTMQPRGMNKTVVNPAGPAEVEGNPGHSAGGSQPSMSRTQEEYFLNLFWESYHCLLPIIDEADFRRHYASLWETPGPVRKQSALVDIVLALCLQYGSTFMPREMPEASGRDSSNDPTMSGRCYYRRCQALLTADLESPSLTTVQCQIFSTVFLCCASFQNMAHTFMATAIRTAQILGLHLEPPADMPRAERELRKRLWWVLHTIDLKASVKLGRPFCADESVITATMPSDDLEASTLNGTRLGSYGPDVTWLTYSLQAHKLTRAMVSIYRPFYDKCGEVMTEKQCGTLYKDPRALETCAEFLASRMPALQAWADSVPAAMKLKRRGDGEAFSTSRSPVEVDALAPTWLQRQRLCLELVYHSQAIQLMRPFITFSPSPGSYTPVTERLAAACANHAVAYTLVMHRAVSETDLMTGWTEYFVWQWNAAVTLVGFVLAYPVHPATPAARRALDRVVEVCDIYGANFAVAASAAGIVRDLTAKADLLIDRLRTGVTAGRDETEHPVAHPSAGGSVASENNPGDPLAWLDPSQQDESFTDFMDWALSVDSFNSFEQFFDTGNTGNIVSFGP